MNDGLNIRVQQRVRPAVLRTEDIVVPDRLTEDEYRNLMLKINSLEIDLFDREVKASQTKTAIVARFQRAWERANTRAQEAQVAFMRTFCIACEVWEQAEYFMNFAILLASDFPERIVQADMWEVEAQRWRVQAQRWRDYYSAEVVEKTNLAIQLETERERAEIQLGTERKKAEIELKEQKIETLKRITEITEQMIAEQANNFCNIVYPIARVLGGVVFGYLFYCNPGLVVRTMNFVLSYVGTSMTFDLDPIVGSGYGMKIGAVCATLVGIVFFGGRAVMVLMGLLKVVSHFCRVLLEMPFLLVYIPKKLLEYPNIVLGILLFGLLMYYNSSSSDLLRLGAAVQEMCAGTVTSYCGNVLGTSPVDNP